jgi:hypothetical protein
MGVVTALILKASASSSSLNSLPKGSLISTLQIRSSFAWVLSLPAIHSYQFEECSLGVEIRSNKRRKYISSFVSQTTISSPKRARFQISAIAGLKEVLIMSKLGTR